VKTDTSTVTRSNVVRQKLTVQQYVNAAEKRHRCNNRQTGSDVVHNKESYVRPVSFVHHNKYSVLCSDYTADDDDDEMGMNDGTV